MSSHDPSALVGITGASLGVQLTGTPAQWVREKYLLHYLPYTAKVTSIWVSKFDIGFAHADSRSGWRFPGQNLCPQDSLFHCFPLHSPPVVHNQ